MPAAASSGPLARAAPMRTGSSSGSAMIDVIRSRARVWTAIAPTSEITGSDAKIDHVQGVRNSSISGDNVGSYRTRVHRLP